MKERKAGIVCCSNPLEFRRSAQVDELRKILKERGIETELSRCMFADTPAGHGEGLARAGELMRFYSEPSITEIYDVSGGDLANEILPYLDYDVIAKSEKPFYGYSDLTAVLNAIYAKTGREGVLYQVRNLVLDESGGQLRRFGTDDLFRLDVEFLRGSAMEGIIAGGNIRCLLKLAGTPYFPDLTDKILLLEAYGGEVSQMVAYLSQLKQMGAFEKVRGILLGTFTKMETGGAVPTMEELVLRVTDGIPLAKTRQVGHGVDSRAVVIGGHYRITGKTAEKSGNFL